MPQSSRAHKQFSQEDRERTINRIAAYVDMQKEIIDAIKAAGGKLSHHDFDKRFSDWIERIDPVTHHTIRERKRGQFLANEFTPGAFLLGGMFGGDLQRYIHLAKLMCIAGIIKDSDEDGTIFYSIVEEE